MCSALPTLTSPGIWTWPPLWVAAAVALCVPRALGAGQGRLWECPGTRKYSVKPQVACKGPPAAKVLTQKLLGCVTCRALPSPLEAQQGPTPALHPAWATAVSHLLLRARWELGPQGVGLEFSWVALPSWSPHSQLTESPPLAPVCACLQKRMGRGQSQGPDRLLLKWSHHQGHPGSPRVTTFVSTVYHPLHGPVVLSSVCPRCHTDPSGSELNTFQ